MGCYKCDRVGRVSRDGPQGVSPLCFLRNQMGNKKANCLMLREGAVSAPASDNLRITDGCEGSAGSTAEMI